MKVVSIVGARPQFIKAAVVSRALRARAGVTELLVHTGQHYDEALSARFFEELDIPEPERHLNVGSASHAVQTGRMLEGLEAVFEELAPDWVLVFGDTNSTLAGALAAAKLHLPVAHVEAGLRSYNRAMPEEINRVLTDHLAQALFAPTEQAVSNLAREGIAGAGVQLVGDVMFDAALRYSSRSEARSTALARLGLTPGGYILATLHRAENTDSGARLAAVLGGLSAVASTLPVVVPLHPRTRASLERERLGADTHALTLIDPVGYLDMVALTRHARLVATDSGGLQKEAFFHGVPCVTLRDETEWTELVEAGWNRLAPPETAAGVAAAIERALEAAVPLARPALYGDGRAAERIAEALVAGGF